MYSTSMVGILIFRKFEILDVSVRSGTFGPVVNRPRVRPVVKGRARRTFSNAVGSNVSSWHRQGVVHILPWQRHASPPERIGSAMPLRFAGHFSCLLEPVSSMRAV